MIRRGGKDEERLYLFDKTFDCGDEIVFVKRTDMPNMDDLIARHYSRYFVPAIFVRPGDRVLDFPCGSGYGQRILTMCGAEYEGRDVDEPTIEYCELTQLGEFIQDDLKDPHLKDRGYNVIACIDGLEHIERRYQERLIGYFHKALKHGGTLVITTPEKTGETVNPYHKHELTRQEFIALLETWFIDIQVLVKQDVLHNGQQTRLKFGICQKED